MRIYPNSRVEAHFRRACGIARFAYNWALAEWKAKYEAGERGMSGYSLVKEFNAIKHEQFPWVAEVTKWAAQKGIGDVGDAFRRFIKGQCAYPKFKKKGRCRDSFYMGSGVFSAENKGVYLSKVGWVRMAEAVRFPGKIKHVVVSREADGWYVSFCVDIDEAQYSYPHRCESQASVGIDLGLSSTVTLSDGTKASLPRSLERYDRLLRRAQRRMSRRKKGSRNREKAKQRLALLWLKVRRIRADWLHKLSSSLVRLYRSIGLEDLNVKGMMKNRRLAKRIGEACWGELRRQIAYKAGLGGSELVLADRFFPSSKTCSSCGNAVDELLLETRTWTCPACGVDHDRDVNAAINLRSVARRHRETQNACGEDVRPGFAGSLAEAGSGIC